MFVCMQILDITCIHLSIWHKVYVYTCMKDVIPVSVLLWVLPWLHTLVPCRLYTPYISHPTTYRLWNHCHSNEISFSKSVYLFSEKSANSSERIQQRATWKPKDSNLGCQISLINSGGKGVTVVQARSHLPLIKSVNPAQPTVIVKSKKAPAFWQPALWFRKQKRI